MILVQFITVKLFLFVVFFFIFIPNSTALSFSSLPKLNNPNKMAIPNVSKEEEDSSSTQPQPQVGKNNKQQLFKMIALDLDGTLLNSNHQISDNSVTYLRYLHERGIVICIATGRSAYATAEIIHKLDFHYDNDNCNHVGFPLVCFNGARGLNVQKGEEGGLLSSSSSSIAKNPMMDGRLKITELFHNHVPLNLTIKTLQFAKSIGCVTNYYIDHDIYAQPVVDWHHEATQKYTHLTGVKYTFCNDDYKGAIDRGLPSKLLILCKEDDIDNVYRKTAEYFKDEAMVIRGSPPFFVEILKNDVCKGNGLEKMCKSLGIGLEECISFGDGNNDVEFIEKSGFGIAMKNAVDTLKSVADGITEYSNNDDGVIYTLKQLEERGKLQLY